MLDAITLKGDIQGFGSRLVRGFLGIDSPFGRRETALLSYALWLGSLFAFVTAVSVTDHGVVPAGPLWPLAILSISAVVAEVQSVRLSARAEASVSFLPIVLAAVIYGPVGAIFVSVVSLALEFRRPYARWFVWTCTRSISAACAGMVALTVADPHEARFGPLVGAVAAATVVEQGGDFLLGSVVAWLRGGTAVEIGRIGSAVLLTITLYTPVSAFLVYTYREVSPWSLALFLFPAFAAQKLFLLYKEQRATAEELARAVVRQEKANLSFATALVATLDARDRYTAGHSTAVATYARDIAERLGLAPSEQKMAHLCGLVHDIGKIGLPAGLLEKPGPLTASERRLMEDHPVIGERILLNVDDYQEIAHIVRHHHERVDGGGYPDCLRGEAIPLISRIIAVADAYNAMTSDRPYRDAMPSHVARIRIAEGVASQFDTTVVAAFEAILAAAPEHYRLGTGESFSLNQPSQPTLRDVAEPSMARLRVVAS